MAPPKIHNYEEKIDLISRLRSEKKSWREVAGIIDIPENSLISHIRLHYDVKIFYVKKPKGQHIFNGNITPTIGIKYLLTISLNACYYIDIEKVKNKNVGVNKMNNEFRRLAKIVYQKEFDRYEKLIEWAKGKGLKFQRPISKPQLMGLIDGSGLTAPASLV